jgi:hypothetical protein
VHPGRGERFDFGLGRALAARHHRASVAHATARGRSHASNKAHHGLVGVAVGLEPLGAILLGLASEKDSKRKGQFGDATKLTTHIRN